MRNAFTIIRLDELTVIVGGSGATDSSRSVLGGIAYNSQYSRRDDSTYRLDTIKQACTQANTNWFWGTDQAKTGQCILDHIDPPAAKPAQ
jgi:hypothetical protein